MAFRIFDNKNQVFKNLIILILYVEVLSEVEARAEENAQVEAYQKLQERLLQTGEFEPDKVQKHFDQIVKPVLDKVRQEEDEANAARIAERAAQAKKFGVAPSADSAPATAPAPEKKEEVVIDGSGFSKPLEFGPQSSPKPSPSTKFEIDLTDAPKSSSEAEIVFEKKPAPSPSASLKK